MHHRILQLICVALISGGPGLAAVESTGTDAAATRSAFLQLIDRPRVPPAPELKESAPADGLLRVDFSFMSEAGKRVPGILIKSAAGAARRPVVIALHGTGGAKENELAFITGLARAGFVAVAIDAPYHGARSTSGNGSAEYVDAILRTYRTGREHPFFYDTVWDVMRLIDYLETRDDVDPKRIGLFGVSKGGIETYLTAAVDLRVAVAVPCIGVESFRWAAEHDSWQSRIGTVQAAFDAAAKDEGVTKPGADFVHKFYARVAPGLDREFDGPAMVALISPRPLLSINGDSDRRTPLPGLNECVDAAHSAYAAAGAEAKFELYLQPHTAHQVTPEGIKRAQAWFVQWLKP
jgi:dienelactone hydrolase